MNIDKIVKKCPKAWEECLLFLRLIENDSNEIGAIDFTPECGKIDISDNGFIWESFHYRKLYDYLDSVGVIVGINPESVNKQQGFRASVNCEYWFESLERTEAEYPAIYKGFKLREQQLKEYRQHADGINDNTVNK